MAGLNRIQLIGNAGRDPEAFGEVVKFSVAVSGGKDKPAEWFNVVCFKKTGELVQQFVRKGKQVYVEGRLQQRTFEKKDGTKGFSTEVVADRVVFLGSAKHKEEAKDAAPPAEEAAEGAGDLPF